MTWLHDPSSSSKWPVPLPTHCCAASIIVICCFNDTRAEVNPRPNYQSHMSHICKLRISSATDYIQPDVLNLLFNLNHWLYWTYLTTLPASLYTMYTWTVIEVLTYSGIYIAFVYLYIIVWSIGIFFSYLILFFCFSFGHHISLLCRFDACTKTNFLVRFWFCRGKLNAPPK